MRTAKSFSISASVSMIASLTASRMSAISLCALLSAGVQNSSPKAFQEVRGIRVPSVIFSAMKKTVSERRT